MSFVVDQVRRIDSQLDRLQLADVSEAAETPQAFTLSHEEAHDAGVTSRIQELQYLIKDLSATASKKPLVPVHRIVSALRHAQLSSNCATCYHTFATGSGFNLLDERPDSSYEHELEWLLLSKAAVQAYGQILDTILQQTIKLNEDIWYWDDVLGSYHYAGLYSIQTSPLRLWAWSKTIYADVRAKESSIGAGWDQFYGLVRDAVRERSLLDIQRRVVSPISLVRQEAKTKQHALKRLKNVNANALGVLLGESLSNESMHDEGLATPVLGSVSEERRHKWKGVVAKSVALMDAVLQNVKDPKITTKNFNDYIATTTQEDHYYEACEISPDFGGLTLKPASVAERLNTILTERLPEYNQKVKQIARRNGQPSSLIRYWLPASVLLVSSTTLYRFIYNRRADILDWIREIGVTVMDFWSNWVVEPAKNIIGTIRHDEGSEVSIMSKKSLEGDRASLERMVVDFATQHPEGPALSSIEIAEIAARVREGDVTPVLRAYEKDLQRPLMGAVRGNLVQALLIQIQKTKVDVEVAMNGIDSILKSQQLLFGFIGLTPGVLVVIGTWRYLGAVFSNRQGLRQGTRQGQLIRILRNVDRILVDGAPTEFGELPYKDHGLLLCEVHVLRQTASEILPTRVFRDFVEEVDDLVDIRAGVARQQKVVERIRWAYSKYFT